MTREQSRSTSAMSWVVSTTVVLTTHDIADVERLCSRVILIDHGRVLYDGTPTELKQRYAPHRTLVVRVAGDGEQTDPISAADVAAFGAEIVPDDGADPDLVRLRFEGGRTAASDLIAALAAR